MAGFHQPEFPIMPERPSARKIPQLPGLPVIGNLPDFNRSRLALYRKIYDQCGDIGIYHLFSKAFAVTSNAELTRQLLLETHADFERSPVMVMMKPILGEGMLTTNNTANSQQRQWILPVFQADRYAGYAEIILAQTRKFSQNWVAGQPLNLSKTLQELTLAIISEALFSTDVLQDCPDFVQAVTNMLHYTDQRLKLTVPIPLSWPLPINQKLKAALKPMDQLLEKLIQSRREALVEAPNAGLDDLLGLLLKVQDSQTQQPLSNRQIRDQIMTFLFAGHETTAHTLSWTFYLLGKHPEVYERLQQELATTLRGQAPTYDDLRQLPYTLQVIKEALRLYPAAYAYGRTATRPLQLGDYHIPKGLVVLACPYMMHRRPDYFPKPEQFDPDRFTLEREAQIPRFAYLPFGAGPRACIGRQFALMEAQLILAALAQPFRFELLNEAGIWPEPMVTLRPSTGIQVKVMVSDQFSQSNPAVASANL